MNEPMTNSKSPFQKFAGIESSSGIVLFGAAVLALLIANSPLEDGFSSLWKFKIGISTSGFELVKPLILWINDGLMAVFFFLIGLEIKRELLLGELNTLRKASFPLFAAVGGMGVPVLLFFLLNRDPGISHAWGIPMATDIAFSLAILTLLGKRIPLGLKIFLTAFAIVDDLGAVMVIAVFYSGSINWTLIGIAILLLAILFFLSWRKIYSKGMFLAFGVVIWLLFLKAGIHPTIAGILMAFTVPIRRKIGIDTWVVQLCRIVDHIKEEENTDAPVLTERQIQKIDDLEDWTDKVQSPLQHLEHRLHNWVAFLIMPLFALSNSGVTFAAGASLDLNMSIIIATCLVLGKFVGITLFSWIGLRMGLAELPGEVRFIHIVGASLLAGVGFTMSIFVANLAFFDQAGLLDSAKTGILAGSAIAGLAGFLLLRFAGRPDRENDTGK